MFDVRVATSPAEREAIYRLRYTIYVEEMGRKQRYADPVARRIEEPLDEHAVLIGAWDEAGEIVGTVRSNYHSFGTYHDMYELDRTGPLLHRTVIGTKLMVVPHLRSRARLGVEMSILAYKDAISRGAVLGFADCNAHLVPLFSSLGYRPYRTPIHHPEYGDVQAMVIGLTDRAWLERVGSPFVPLIPEEGLTPEVEAVLYGSVLAGPDRPARAAPTPV
jgi:hypothetical protein